MEHAKANLIFVAYQIFFPPGHEAETVATAFLDIYQAEQYQTCLWFKCYESGQLLRIEAEDESGDVVGVTVDKNNVTLNNRKGELVSQGTSSLGIDLVDYRWHQLCLNAKKSGTEAFLDNKLLFEIDQGTWAFTAFRILILVVRLKQCLVNL